MSLSGIRLRGPARSASGIHLETLVTVRRLSGDAAVALWRSLVRSVEEGEVMVEFHVESSESLDEWHATTSFGGHLSVRRLPCQPALFYIGQDEAVYSSESAASRHWVVKWRSGASCLSFDLVFLMGAPLLSQDHDGVIRSSMR